jgi:hypothetical protein
VGEWLSAVKVAYRDLQYVVQFLIWFGVGETVPREDACSTPGSRDSLYEVMTSAMDQPTYVNASSGSRRARPSAAHLSWPGR